MNARNPYLVKEVKRKRLEEAERKNPIQRKTRRRCKNCTVNVKELMK